MLHEHAITYQDQLTVSDLDYLVKKANKLGRSGREIISIHEELDAEGTHVYYNVVGRINEVVMQKRLENECQTPERCDW